MQIRGEHLLIVPTLILGSLLAWQLVYLFPFPQQTEKAHLTIGVLSLVSNQSTETVFQALSDELHKHDDITWNIDAHWAKQDYTLLHAMTDEVLLQQPDVIVTLGATATKTLLQHQKKRETSIPHVFIGLHPKVWEPLFAEYPEARNHMTGSIGSENWARISQTLQHLIPNLSRVMIPLPEKTNSADISFASLQKEFARSGIRCDKVIIEAHQTATQRIQPYLESADVVMFLRESMSLNRFSIIQLAERSGVPLHASDKATIENGAVMGYGWDERIGGVIAGQQVKKFLISQTALSDLPVIDMNKHASQFFINRAALATQGNRLNKQVLFCIENGFITRDSKDIV